MLRTVFGPVLGVVVASRNERDRLLGLFQFGSEHQCQVTACKLLASESIAFFFIHILSNRVLDTIEFMFYYLCQTSSDLLRRNRP